ncbi:MAG: hypothetical protein QM831_41115 [Kofleriaceae bacterium]
MRWGLVLAVGVASAKPLPKGLTVALKGNQLYATRDGVSVRVGREGRTYDNLKSIDVADDGTVKIAVDDTTCTSGDGEPFETSLADIDSSIENTLGMRSHLARKYDDAIKHFQIAVDKAPDDQSTSPTCFRRRAWANTSTTPTRRSRSPRRSIRNGSRGASPSIATSRP